MGALMSLSSELNAQTKRYKMKTVQNEMQLLPSLKRNSELQVCIQREMGKDMCYYYATDALSE